MIPLLRFARKIPAGAMLVPMFSAAVINTIAPGIWETGSYTTLFFSNDTTIVLMYITLFYTGCQIRLKELPVALSRGGSHVLLKYLAGAGFYLWVAEKFGMEGIFGVCSLSILCALTNCNSNLYLSLMETYGDSADMAARPMFNLNSGPMLSLLTIGMSGASDFKMIEIFGILVPVVVGILLSMIDPEIREHSQSAIKYLIPVAGFVIGTGINLADVVKSGFGGISLFLIVLFVTGPVAFLLDRLILKRPGYAGMATVSVAGNCVAVPAMVAAAAPEFAPYVSLATVQISAAVVISAIACPFIVDYIAKRFSKVRSNDCFTKNI